MTRARRHRRPAGLVQVRGPRNGELAPRPSGGQPRAGAPATERLEVRLTEAEMAAYRAAATDAGLDLSRWVRRLCHAAAGIRAADGVEP